MQCAACDGVMPLNARFCPACGALAIPTTVIEERKLVTVVFCDLVGSTPLSERLDPETLRSVILRYFAAMRDTIEEFGGTVEKFIGDAVMAVFGVPTMHEDDARRAACAALGMLDALATLNTDLESTLGVCLQVRIGVHTGPAVTSTDVSTRQALVSGDTVNIAARLEQNAGHGEILIGPVTHAAIGGAARTEPVGPLRLKGKERTLMTYRLVSIGRDDPEMLRRFDTPFVGRVSELGELDHALDRVATGGGSDLVTVSGEPGIGKTRLVRTWLERTDREQAHGATRCRPYGEHGSLAPLADVVRQLLAVRLTHDAEALAALDAGLLRDGTPGASLDGTCIALVRVLHRISRDRPVVVTVDDCHWANDLLLDVLGRLVAMARRSAVLFVCLARPELAERRPGWVAVGSRSLRLASLSTPECEVMVSALTEVGAHGAVAATAVVEAAGGNPFYLEQLLAAAEVGPARDLPHSLQSLLGARIDALDPLERTTLDLAAVLGREFVPHHVTALAGLGPEGHPGGVLATDADLVRVALTGLGRRDLIETAGSPSDPERYLRFSNGLIHEATYQAMAKRTRADRHERAADVLAGRRAAVATIGGHLERAYRYRAELGLRDGPTDELRRRAARLLAVAGTQASRRSDLAWAGALLGRAVELFVTGEPGWAGAARQLGEIGIASGHAEQGRELLRAVLESSSEAVETAHARLALTVADRAPSVEAAAAVARETMLVFEVAADDLGQARAHIRIAQEQQLLGRHVEADRHLTAGLTHAARCAAEPERALALGAAGVSLWRGPTPVPAAVARCEELLGEHGSSRPAVWITLSCPLAVLLALDDRWSDARARLTEAGRLADELGYAESKVVMPIFEAAVAALAGETRTALDRLDQAAAAARALSAGGLLSAVEREAARLLLDQGRHVEAADRLAAVDTSTELLRSDLADLDGLRGRLAAARGDTAEALELAARAVSVAATTDSPIVRAVAALDRAFVLRRSGLVPEAAEAAAEARRRFGGKGHRPGLRWTRRLLAQLAEARAQQERKGA